MTNEQKVRKAHSQQLRKVAEFVHNHQDWSLSNIFIWIEEAYGQAALTHESATAEECPVVGEAVSARYEYRQRFLRSDDWTEWEECSREMYESVTSNWYANDHVREARVICTHPPRASEDAPGITPERVDADGTEHYFVDGIGDLIPSKHAIRYTHSLIQSMDDEDRAMLDQALAAKQPSQTRG